MIDNLDKQFEELRDAVRELALVTQRVRIKTEIVAEQMEQHRSESVGDSDE